MGTLYSLPATYIPYYPISILPDPADPIEYRWLYDIAQFTYRYTKYYATIITFNGAGSTFAFNYSTLGCSMIPILKAYVYGATWGGGAVDGFTGRNTPNLTYTYFYNIGTTGATFCFMLYNPLTGQFYNTTGTFMLIAYM